MITTDTVTITGPTRTVTLGDVPAGVGVDGTWSGITLDRLTVHPAEIVVETADVPYVDGGVIAAGTLGLRYVEIEGAVGARTRQDLNALCRRLAEACGWVGQVVRDPVELRWTPESTEVSAQAHIQRLDWGRPEGTTVTFHAQGVLVSPVLSATTTRSAAIGLSPSTATPVGGARVWPIVEVTGPTSGTCTGIRVRNLTTGEQVSLTGLAFGAGQTLRVDSTPGLERIDIDGVSVMGQRTPGEGWLSLIPGPNSLQIVVTGGSSTGVVGSVEWRDGWVS